MTPQSRKKEGAIADLDQRLGGIATLFGTQAQTSATADDYLEDANLYRLDPHKIELDGPYVRLVDDHDPEFAAFADGVREKGEIEQPIGIRTVGSALEGKRYILIYGMRRWRASLHAGHATVPVRDYGNITEAQSVALQMLENEARSKPHPVDTAYGYHLLIHGGQSQASIARLHGKDSGYVSYMCSVGEALGTVSADQRARLRRSPRVTVRAFQEIGKIDGGPEARAAALLKLADDPESTVAEAVRERLQREKGAFQAQSTRNGRSFRVAWRETDLRDDPRGFARTFLERVADEHEILAERLRQIEAKQRKTRRGPKQKGDPDDLALAAEQLAQAVAQLRTLLDSTS